MHYAILADIHANLAAFEAVLGDIEKKGGVDEIWCLGDIVGYGPDPCRCIELLRKYNHVCVIGNHDLAAIGKMELSYFNPYAATACQWTSGQLSGDDIAYLEGLPLTIEKGEFLLAHGSPAEPALEYVMSTSIAARNFSFFQLPYCLVGHTHVPAAFREEEGECLSVKFSPGIGMVLGKSRMIINPGGVGQPRDGDPRASYAIYDDEGRILRLYRIPYDISATQDKMMQAGLPVHLITRLEAGR
ncbi:MAG: metallophosphoesterase family protein [Dehalococcoidales bacterium]|nr:metallophosphoesterase family protein [Dehalococcoidales bacterium]